MIIMAFKLTVVACTEGDNKGAARRRSSKKVRRREASEGMLEA